MRSLLCQTFALHRAARNTHNYRPPMKCCNRVLGATWQTLMCRAASVIFLFERCPNRRSFAYTRVTCSMVVLSNRQLNIRYSTNAPRTDYLISETETSKRTLPTPIAV